MKTLIWIIVLLAIIVGIWYWVRNPDGTNVTENPVGQVNIEDNSGAVNGTSTEPQDDSGFQDKG